MSYEEETRSLLLSVEKRLSQGHAELLQLSNDFRDEQTDTQKRCIDFCALKERVEAIEKKLTSETSGVTLAQLLLGVEKRIAALESRIEEIVPTLTSSVKPAPENKAPTTWSPDPDKPRSIVCSRCGNPLRQYNPTTGTHVMCYDPCECLQKMPTPRDDVPHGTPNPGPLGEPCFGESTYDEKTDTYHSKVTIPFELNLATKKDIANLKAMIARPGVIAGEINDAVATFVGVLREEIAKAAEDAYLARKNVDHLVATVEILAAGVEVLKADMCSSFQALRDHDEREDKKTEEIQHEQSRLRTDIASCAASRHDIIELREAHKNHLKEVLAEARLTSDEGEQAARTFLLEEFRKIVSEEVAQLAAKLTKEPNKFTCED